MTVRKITTPAVPEPAGGISSNSLVVKAFVSLDLQAEVDAVPVRGAGAA